MICVDINGGLGNQMFQYATAYAMAKSRDDRLLLDVSHMDSEYQKSENITLREYQLGNFRISAELADLKLSITDNKLRKLINRYFKFYQLGGIATVLSTKFVHDRDCYSYLPEQFPKNKNMYLCGFFQSWKYFDTYQDELLREFTVKDEILSADAKSMIMKCKNTKSVGVHIRRGDYLNCPDWLIHERFFVEAIDRIKEEIGQDISLYVFCNEIGFAEKLFADLRDVVFVTAENKYSDLEEFCILSACCNQIISNSSFSWWAAYLNDTPSKTIIAPEYSHWSRAYYPDNWITLKAQSAKIECIENEKGEKA